MKDKDWQSLAGSLILPPEPKIERKGLEALSPEEAEKLRSYYAAQNELVEVPSSPLNSFDKMVQLHRSSTEAALKLMIAKNHDYAGGNPYSPTYDFFKNFRKRGGKGIATRLDDKISRLDTFLESGRLEVSDEKLEDTVLDIINYAVIALGWVQLKDESL